MRSTEDAESSIGNALRGRCGDAEGCPASTEDTSRIGPDEAVVNLS
jgi:hypothetical protein